ncbi:hypothetical protein ACFLZW_03810 [Chloroflexota bacterium]
MTGLKKYWLPVFLLTLMMGLIIGFRAYLMANIIEPVALLFWAVWQIIASVDQIIYWTALIVFCVILVFRLIPFRKDKTPNSSYNHTYKELNRVEFWQILFKEAVRGKNGSEDLRDSLMKLLLAVVDQKGRVEPAESTLIKPDKNILLPPALHKYLFPPSRKNRFLSIGPLSDFKLLIPRWQRRRTGEFNHKDNTAIKELLSWMEDDLEINTKLEVNNEK